MSLATVFIAFFQLAPVFGLSLLWAALFYALGHVVIFYLTPRIRSLTTSGSTLHGFLKDSYGSEGLKLTASIATTIGFIGIFATELIVGTRLLQSLLPNVDSYLPSLLLIGMVLVAYSILGGFKSVVRTDLLQTSAVILFCGLMIYLAFHFGAPTSGEPLIPDNLIANWKLAPLGVVAPSVIFLMMLNFFLINVPFPLVDMSAWQRIVAAKDTKAAKSGVGLAAIMFFITWGAILFAALALTETAGADSAGGLATILINFGGEGWFSLILTCMGFAALVAAMLSTADSFLIAAGQTISMDITDRKFFEKHPIEDSATVSQSDNLLPMDSTHRKVIGRARMQMGGIAIIGLILCIALTHIGFDVVSFVFAIYGSALALAPVVLCGLLLAKKLDLKRVQTFAILSVATGIVVGWAYGITSVTAQQGSFAWSLASWWILPDGVSVYNAPTIAFGFSLVIMIIGLVFRARRVVPTKQP